jgi:dolichol-phosphate mannosyltransferase
MKNKNLLLFTATYNEKKNINIIFKKIKNLNIEHDMLIVNDQSTDGTSEYLKLAKKNYKNLHIFERKSKLGLNTAYNYAFNFAKKKNYKYLITFDADMQHDVSLIPIFYKNLRVNNFVIGSRYIKGGKCQLSGFRFLLSYYGNKIIKLFFNTKINEFTTSFRGFDKKSINILNKNQIKSSGYSFMMECMHIIIKEKLKIKEIPITFYKRDFGKSKLPRVEIFRTIYNLIRIVFFK